MSHLVLDSHPHTTFGRGILLRDKYNQHGKTAHAHRLQIMTRDG